MDKSGFSHLVEIKDLKLKLLNKVAALMIHEPRYYAPDPSATQADLTLLLTELAAQDPEFVWKVILYVRDDLNIRSTANWMMAVAANLKPCHAFFEKYFSSCVRLPSDLLEVVNLYLSLPNRYLPDRSLPAALRTAVQHKFIEFDDYQLAKYNKEKSQKKKAKLAKAKEAGAAFATPSKSGKGSLATTAAEGGAPEKDGNKGPSKLTLKQLIRKVHVAEPADSVCAILGKKYPESGEAFTKMGLKGEFDASKAGKRMKLPVPVTWETQLSALGNQHSTWEKLIDEKKLPFMAMLRNLRNLIVTGISPDHHEQILARLTDEKSVTSSRQLPWRFLSAYQAIDIDLEKLMNDVLDHDGSKYKIIQVPVKGKKGKQMAAKRTIRKRVIIPVHMPDIPLIKRYQEAIDTAIRLATLHNLPPIDGKTVIFCDVSGSMKQPCKSKGNMGTIQQAFEIGILLGLMIQSCCDDCDFRIFSSPGRTGRCHLSVPLVENTILDNIKRVTKESEKLGGGTDFPFDYLEDLIARKEKIDNFIILSDMMIAPGRTEMSSSSSHRSTVSSILAEYRKKVNPDLLFVSVDLCGSGSSLVEVCEGKHPNDVLISGFSDGILKFIAQRGTIDKQLEYVEGIAQTKRLGYKKKRADKPRDATKQARQDETEGAAMEVAEEDAGKGKDKEN